MTQKIAIIIGAGPAGLTAAHELLHHTDIVPVVLEETGDLGGISKTVVYKGNRIDIGGHRFFSKSDKVMNWWLNILPLGGPSLVGDPILSGVMDKGRSKTAARETDEENVMLVRNRISRIYYLRQFFDYPVQLSYDVLKKLGVKRTAKIVQGFLKAKLTPINPEKSLEDFLINRFGKELYNTFFKDYTEKVWGVACREIPPDWGVQRIKGLSVGKAIAHAVKKTVSRDASISQKRTETSLIEKFLYPKYGPGQMWETVAGIVTGKGGRIHLKHKVVGLHTDAGRIIGVTALNAAEGKKVRVKGDYFFSSMPVKDLILASDAHIPSKVKRVALNLPYRDFITVGLLLEKICVKDNNQVGPPAKIIPDNWIYIQEKDVKLGRLQIFNNWSPYMVRDSEKVWVGLEYFCNEGDELWNRSDSQLKQLAIDELAMIELIEPEDVLDGVTIRMPKAYPAYFGSYDMFEVLRDYLDQYENLFLIGRNGQHRYNNQDHSMLTAMAAVENIVNKKRSKENIWAINADEDYHERKD